VLTWKNAGGEGPRWPRLSGEFCRRFPGCALASEAGEPRREGTPPCPPLSHRTNPAATAGRNCWAWSALCAGWHSPGTCHWLRHWAESGTRTATTTKGVMRPSKPTRNGPRTCQTRGPFYAPCEPLRPCRPRGMTPPKTGPPGAAPTPSSRRPHGTDNREVDTVSTTLPPHEPGRHGWAELLTLVGAVRRLAFDRSLPPPEALGRIRDAFTDYDQQRGMP
jgi:hypothetical protein